MNLRFGRGPARFSFAAILTLGALPGGCGAPSRAPAPAPAPEPALQAPEPILSTARHGVEVHWWIADDTDGAVAKVLSRYLSPLMPTDDDLRRRWQGNGLRMVRIPAEEITLLQRRLPPLRARRRLWVGWNSTWDEVFQGRRAGGAGALLIDGQRASLPAGVLRFIARAWPAPRLEGDALRGFTSPPIARLELACQLHIDPVLNAADVFQEPRQIPPQDAGPVFHTLTLETALEDGFAYVITSESPDVAWESLQPADSPHPPAPPAPPDDAEDGAFDAFAAEPLGPPSVRALTIGQAMLSARFEETGIRDFRVLVLILPRCPERYRLIP